VKVGIVTKEWPPLIYGGAGVHVWQLAQALGQKREKISLDVHCFGENREGALGYSLPEEMSGLNPALAAIETDLLIAQNLAEVDLIHTHTWYTNLAGHFGSLLHGIPHILTAHSLEPDRPWKAEQLGGGYRISSYAEETAYHSAAAIISVSEGMKRDILRVYPNIDSHKIHTVHNGVDAERFSPTFDENLLASKGIHGRYAIFVGRITRQKGLSHLLRAWNEVSPEYGLVIAAGSPDEPQIGKEVEGLIDALATKRGNIWWFPEMLPQHDLSVLLSHADLFICPSIYEPLGIVNLEAMACQTAVLASRVGGIPEVVLEGITGELVNYETDPIMFEQSLAEGITTLMGNPDLLANYGRAGRRRVIESFSWDSIAEATIDIYNTVLAGSQK
jgi:alpha-maltose-1-phosphate synthase